MKKEGSSTPSNSPRYGTAPLSSEEVINLSRKSLSSHYPYVPALGFVPMERFLNIAPEMARNSLVSDSVSPASEKQLQRTWKDELQYAKETFNGNMSPKQAIVQPPAPTKRSYVKQQVPEGEGQFICDECDKAFNKQSSLARHKYEHSGKYCSILMHNQIYASPYPKDKLNIGTSKWHCSMLNLLYYLELDINSILFVCLCVFLLFLFFFFFFFFFQSNL